MVNVTVKPGMLSGTTVLLRLVGVFVLKSKRSQQKAGRAGSCSANSPECHVLSIASFCLSGRVGGFS